MVDFSIFCGFWAISAIVGRVWKAVVAVGDADVSKVVADDVGGEKMVIPSEISLVIALVVLT